MKPKKVPKQEIFDQAMKAWGGRPARTPPETAAQRLKERLAQAPRPVATWRLAAAAMVLISVSSLVWVAVRNGKPVLPGIEPTPIAAVPGAYEPPPLDENVVLWWIDPETPVYFVLGSGTIKKGETQ